VDVESRKIGDRSCVPNSCLRERSAFGLMSCGIAPRKFRALPNKFCSLTFHVMLNLSRIQGRMLKSGSSPSTDLPTPPMYARIHVPLAAPLASDLFKDTAKQHVTSLRCSAIADEPGQSCLVSALQGWVASQISSSDLTAVAALSFIPCT
jgi:hypothetical protein